MGPRSEGIFTVEFPIEDLDMKRGELRIEAEELTRASADEDGLVRIGPVEAEVSHLTRTVKTCVPVAWYGPKPSIRGYVD